MDKLVNPLTRCLAIGSAGFIGALARYWIAVFFNTYVSPFPLGTFLINLSGSFLLGWFATAAGTRFNVSEPMRLAIIVGFLGTFTTFSSLMYDSDHMLRHDRVGAGLLNLVGSFVLGMVCVRLGVLVASR